MALSKEQWDQEQKRLKRIYRLIVDNIEFLEKQVKENVQRIKRSNKVMWSSGKSHHYDFDDIVENLSLLDGVYTDIMRHENILVQLRKMYLLQKNAYFGRFDFKEEGFDDTDEIYIGTSTLEGDKSEILIYDWRAAISSMFYENEIGRAGFESPSGRIEGEITLKRQYRIFRDEILSMFESSLVIDDEILQKVLSESKNSRMGTIVASIQKEQNKAIRDDEHKVVFVDGPAGSGKTSIALHRAAWLLYKNRGKMNARNIIVFSPNDIFNDYISEVLPNLGEENLIMSTFMKLAESYLGGGYNYEDNYSQMEGILMKSEAVDEEAIKEKSGKEFVESMESHIKNIIGKGQRFEDIESNGVMLARKEELEKLFYEDYKMHSVATRMEKISTMLEKRLAGYTRKIRKEFVESAKLNPKEGKKTATAARQAIDELRKKAYAQTHPSPFEEYHKFLFETGRRKYALRFKKAYEKKRIEYQDIAPVMYIKILMGYSWDSEDIKHIIIDEVQDYSYLEMKIFSKLFNNIPMTLLGDANQTINHLIDTNDLKKEATGESFTVRLEKSYRPTRQIAEFCNKIIGSELNYEYIDRNGEKPCVIKSGGPIESPVKKHIEKYVKNGNQSIAVITKTAATADRLHQLIGNGEIRLIKKTDTNFSTGIVVIPSYLAKGLEFDAVIVIDIETDHFEGERDRKLFYTCCTRALHDLGVIYEDKAPYGADAF